MSNGKCLRVIKCDFRGWVGSACWNTGKVCPDGLALVTSGAETVKLPGPKPSPSDMAEAHWSYVNSVLVAHGVPDDHREVAKHHYIAAFIHGFKHGAADRVAGPEGIK